MEVRNGMVNPSEGPYNYEYLQVEFLDEFGYSIDKVTKEETYITVSCTDNCDTCSG